MSNVVSGLRKGKNLRCKYPKHGRLNILKWYEGVVEKAGIGPNGAYASIRSEDGQYRTLRCDKMLDAVLS
tara:strand:- start:96 stop:305 length:210 start_codon:yes stop_codon:yes gene_type:complete